MKAMIYIFSLFFWVNISYSTELPPLKLQDNFPFIGLEATVGYIQKENGEKFLVVETPDGTKLIKVKAKPAELINKPKN